MSSINSERSYPISPWLTRLLWSGVIVLTLIGVVASIGRGLFVDDMGVRMEPARERVLDSFRREDPFPAQRASEVHRFDSRFAAHPVMTLLHVLAGGVFLILALFQFSPRIRRRHVRFHRWSGRFLVLIAFLAVVSGAFFGIRIPFSGRAEAGIIAFVAASFLFSMSLAVVAIKRHEVARHREWMIRSFAMAIGVSTVRVVGLALDLTLTPAGVSPAEVFVHSLWIGWVLTLGAAELWIRYTRTVSFRDNFSAVRG